MSYSGKTIYECYRRWQIDALPHIHLLARALGVPFADNNPSWRESNHEAGLWYRHHERDKVKFGKCLIVKGDRTAGRPRPVGSLEKELAIVGEWDEYPEDQAGRGSLVAADIA